MPIGIRRSGVNKACVVETQAIPQEPITKPLKFESCPQGRGHNLTESLILAQSERWRHA